ncbi:hypothetical protein GOP47_0021091 [Adiantum capillus-veneris]|uniref:Peroxidase n=1 Tax=Adiantum capillus-veneris TaxID=13818 RepID=A0A9D4Z9C0_ADICA|nr:hypothetical protein GOP47_0021091 [Adiantum capillus-veneris]
MGFATALTCTQLYPHFPHLLLLLLLLNISDLHVNAQLSSSFYETSCPTVVTVVEGVVRQAIEAEARMAASLLRLHFHDCFVHGCDGPVLLDDTATVTGEKTALPNNNSIRGFEVVDEIKSAVEAVCNATVSCADILALAANASATLVGGPSWTVLLGRRDATNPASIAEVTAALPNPNSDMPTIIGRFAAVGLNVEDTVALSGGHTIGQARCVSFSARLYNFSGTGAPDPAIDADFLASLQSTCPQGGDANVLRPLDATTADTFDVGYYSNLQSNRGLLQSDQELTSDANTAPLTAPQGEIRLNCHVVNSA